MQSTAIDNYRVNTIDTIDTIDRIDCINQYKYNQYDRSDQLTLQTSPTQLHHCCFLFRFALLIKLSSSVVLHPVTSCWYAHLCLCFPLNATVIPTAEVRLISQRGIAYCCVYHVKIFLPVFILLTEPSSYVPGAINCNN